MTKKKPLPGPGWVGAVFLLASACGRLGYDPMRDDGGGEDGAALHDAVQADDMVRPDAGRLDAGDAAGPLGAFGVPEPVVELNTASLEDDPTLTADMLEIYFERAGTIWFSTRLDSADAWAPPQPATGISAGAETTCALAPDGLTIYFASSRASADNEIYVATRPTRADAWTIPVRVAELSAVGADDGGAFSPNGTYALMYSTRASPDTDLFQSTRGSPSDPWTLPVPVAELNSPSEDESAWVSTDLLHVYWSSDRPGTAGSCDLWTTRRASVASPWDAPARIDELSTVGEEQDPWLSPDERTIFFTSDSSGSRDIFIARR